MEEKFESIIIFSPNATILAETHFEEKITKIIGDEKLKKIEKIGIKRLAYEIKKHKKGYYLIICFNGNNKKAVELEEYYRKNHNVLKFMTMKIED